MYYVPNMYKKNTQKNCYIWISILKICPSFKDQNRYNSWMNYYRPNNKAHNFDSEFDFFKGLGQVSGNFDQMPGITLKSRSKFCTLAFQRKFMSYNVPKGHLLSETSCNWHFSFVIGPSHLPQWSKSKKSCNFGEVAIFASIFFFKLSSSEEASKVNIIFLNNYE